jgi:hypothetical protein
LTILGPRQLINSFQIGTLPILFYNLPTKRGRKMAGECRSLVHDPGQLNRTVLQQRPRTKALCPADDLAPAEQDITRLGYSEAKEIKASRWQPLPAQDFGFDPVSP